MTEPKTNDKKYKITFTLSSKQPDGTDEKTKICARILKVDDKSVCVEFMMLEGEQMSYINHYKSLKKKLDIYSDTLVETTL